MKTLKRTFFQSSKFCSFKWQLLLAIFCFVNSTFSFSQSFTYFTPEWANCIGQNNSYYETINNAILHSNGNIYCVGYSVHGVHDFLISKISPITGIEEFSSSQIISASTDILHAVAESSDGTIIAVGIVGNHSTLYPNYYGAGDLVVVRYNNQDGQIINIKTFGGTKIDRAYSVVCNSDSSIVIAGKTGSTDNDFSDTNAKGGVDALLMKLDFNFNVIWQIRVGTSGEDCFNKVIKSRDGNYLCVGYSKPDTGNFYKSNVLFSKITDAGNLIITKYYSSTTDTLSTALSIAENTINGNLFIVGTDYDNFMANYDGKAFIIKTNFNGTQIKRIDYSYKKATSFRDVVIIDDTLFVAGEVAVTVRKMGIYKFDENLNNINQSGYLTVGSNDVPYSIIYTDNSFILSGMCYGSEGSGDYWNNYFSTGVYDAAILKIGKSNLINVPIVEISDEVNVYPNPTSNYLYIDWNKPSEIGCVTIYNSLGEKILETSDFVCGDQINLSSFSKGIYLVNLKTNNLSLQKLLVIN